MYCYNTPAAFIRFSVIVISGLYHISHVKQTGIKGETTFLCPLGVVNMSFPLSDQPVFGEWFIFVEAQGHTYNVSFEVQKYGEAMHIQYKGVWHNRIIFVITFILFYSHI